MAGPSAPPAATELPTTYVTLNLAGQLCGVPVSAVRDVLRQQPIAPVPMAPPDVAGNLNLRGRIVTAINLRRRLNLPPAPPGLQPMALVTESNGELYALLVDQVCEVLSPDRKRFEPNPPTLPVTWTKYSAGLYRLENSLMIVLDLSRLLALSVEAS
ncbi:chemotaxis protein CheW [Acidisphaera sp. L21]|uniref:chemotaxis protein CheW n=1 Tax=Acidisphaera sp. L21 TaxID=1641851 RepID=UPI0020B12129|nr:chemotaxis protein CheW [Acidisphaera sp. L21]